MADSIVRQLYPEFKKVAESSAKVANDLVQSVENHEKELHAKFEKYLEGRSRSTSLDVARLELEREQRCHAEAESEIVCAEQSVVKAEKREQVRVDKLKSSATALQKSGIDVAKEQSMREMYQDMIDKLAEMHTLSRQSQRSSLANERSLLDEQVSSMSREVDELQQEVNDLTAALEATGYEGLLHETRRSAMLMMKNNYTEMKNELLRLRLATHTLRIRARSAQANLAIEK